MTLELKKCCPIVVLTLGLNNLNVIHLAINHDDDGGITFDKYGPDRLDNSFPSGGTLSSGASFLWVIGRKYFNIPCPDIT